MIATHELRLTEDQWTGLYDHLFPGDGDEHGAVILAGIVENVTTTRLIAREVVHAEDGVDYGPGPTGFWRLNASFVAALSGSAAEEGLAYIAVHCHGGSNSVGLSAQDRRSQEKTYPALLDILDGPPVAGAVFATGAAAGDIWLPDRTRVPLDRVIVTGLGRQVLTPAPDPTGRAVDGRFGRQALLFGDQGQDVLGSLTVAVIGCGGIGSLLVELLARLGVGHIIVVDNDIVEVTNLSRITGSRRLDAMEWFTRAGRPRWLQTIGRRLARRKIDVAARIAKRANRHCKVTRIDGDVATIDVAAQLTGVDYLFLAADTYRARLVVNAIAFQYGIPGVQLGAKVRTRISDGSIIDIYSVVRPFGPSHGCLLCNGLVPAAGLSDEALTATQRRNQRYVDDTEVLAPSVITLNAVAAAHAVDEFMFHATGLPRTQDAVHHVAYRTLSSDVERTEPASDPMCPECGDVTRSRRGRGDTVLLPTTDA